MKNIKHNFTTHNISISDTTCSYANLLSTAPVQLLKGQNVALSSNSALYAFRTQSCTCTLFLSIVFIVRLCILPLKLVFNACTYVLQHFVCCNTTKKPNYYFLTFKPFQTNVIFQRNVVELLLNK